MSVSTRLIVSSTLYALEIVINPLWLTVVAPSLSTERRVRPKLLVDLPPAVRKQIEEVRVDSRGRLIPRLYSKMAASKELRNMLNLNAKSDAADVTKLSDEELITTLAAQARELGVDIKLDYTFHLPKKDDGNSG